MNNELVPQPNWWQRNWKWVIPVGGCFTILVVIIFFIGSIFYGVTNVLENSEPFEHAINKINNDQELIELLGSPIEKDGMPQGHINWNNNKKSADMKIPIAGPKGKAVLYIIAHGEGDDWNYDEIRVTVKDNEEIQLLDNDWK